MDYNFVPTNSMASTSFDILKMDGVEDPLINVNKLATMDLEESYFDMTVNFLKEANNEICEHKATLYRAISEASDQYVVLESFSEFFSKIKDIIDKFLKFMKSLFNRFVTSLMSMFNNDKYIIKHKDKLKLFKSSDNFDFDGYNFTFRPDVPLANAALTFNKDLFEDLYEKTSGTGMRLDTDKVKDVVSNINYEDLYDTFRAEVLQRQGSKIYQSDFSEELFREFRNNELDTDTIEIDSTEVRKALARFENYKKTKSNLDREMKNIDKAYESVKKQVNEITKNGGNMSVAAFVSKLPDNRFATVNQIPTTNDGVNISSDLMIQMDLYVKAKVDEITEYSNIHALAYSAKLDALKACYIQDRNILYTALNKVQRTDAKRKEDK